MSLRRSLLLVSLLAVLAPAEGLAADVRLVSRDVPLGRTSGPTRSLAARPAPRAFDMVGLHWRGSGRVWFRTARESGAWSAWKPARPEDEDRPDAASREAAAAGGWKLGNPYWTGRSRSIQYRLSGRVMRLRAFFLTIPAAPASAAVAARPDMPAIVRRSQWGADESIVRAPPSYAGRIGFSVVHHTAGANGYSRAQSAGIVRGIQRYHVLANGWNDIGYNFLVDKYGRIFEGRAGGLARAVIGAHAQGFNTGSVGVAVLGTYGSTAISAGARAALERLLAWRLDVAHVDPVSVVNATSYGSDRFQAGTTIRLRAVSGHRDTGYTTCPGSDLYGDLGAIARGASRIGLPKLYEPRVRGAVGGPVRFTARLSGSRSWLVTVKNGSGSVVARGSGSGTAVDWTWDSAAAPIDRYTYVIASGSRTRPATGVVPAPPPLAVTRLRRDPGVLTPNGDGVSERTRISFSLNVRATVSLAVLDSGSPVRTLLREGEMPAGTVSVSWDGTTDGGRPAPDGRYRLRATARTSRGEEVTRAATVVVDRVLGALAVAPAAFSPNGDGRRDRIGFGFDLTRRADVRARVVGGGRVAATLLSATLPAGRHGGSWDGRSGSALAADGRYELLVDATTHLGTRRLTRGFVLDTTRPRVRVLQAVVDDGVTRLHLALSEPARVWISYGTDSWDDGRSIVAERPAGEFRVRRRFDARVVRVVARDAAGNRSRAVFATPARG